MPSKIIVGTYANGYRVVGLSKGATFKSFTVHSLIALTFHGERPEGMLIRHLNDNPVDNRLINLEYGTTADNIADYIRNRNTA